MENFENKRKELLKAYGNPILSTKEHKDISKILTKNSYYSNDNVIIESNEFINKLKYDASKFKHSHSGYFSNPTEFHHWLNDSPKIFSEESLGLINTLSPEEKSSCYYIDLMLLYNELFNDRLNTIPLCLYGALDKPLLPTVNIKLYNFFKDFLEIKPIINDPDAMKLLQFISLASFYSEERYLLLTAQSLFRSISGKAYPRTKKSPNFPGPLYETIENNLDLLSNIKFKNNSPILSYSIYKPSIANIYCVTLNSLLFEIILKYPVCQLCDFDNITIDDIMD